MGLLEQEIKELRTMNTQLIVGKIKPDEVSARIAIYSQTEKRARLMLQIHAMGAKFGKKHLTSISNTQLIGDGSVIDLNTEIAKETIFCPEQEKVIIRLECKEFSEKTGNLSVCETCNNFKVTRRLLDQVITNK